MGQGMEQGPAGEVRPPLSPAPSAHLQGQPGFKGKGSRLHPPELMLLE